MHTPAVGVRGWGGRCAWGRGPVRGSHGGGIRAACLQRLLEGVDDERGAPQPEKEEAEPAHPRAEAFEHRLLRVVDLGWAPA